MPCLCLLQHWNQQRMRVSRAHRGNSRDECLETMKGQCKVTSCQCAATRHSHDAARLQQTRVKSKCAYYKQSISEDSPQEAGKEGEGAKGWVGMFDMDLPRCCCTDSMTHCHAQPDSTHSAWIGSSWMCMTPTCTAL